MRRRAGLATGRIAWLGIVAAGAGLLLTGCRSRPAHAAPSVEITLVPPAEAGGAEKLDTIEGRVTGSVPGQRIVLYARSGDWYVQPFADQPFTTIQADSTWKSSTHLGTEYAAFLVDPQYIPVALTPTLPGIGGGIAAVAVVEGEPVFWRTRWFQLSCLLALVLAGWAFHRFRVKQLTRELKLRSDERLAERTRIAQELYDTLLQGFLGTSMQLHLAVDQLPEGAPDRLRLNRVLQVMEQVTEEGRIVLQGLRSSDAEGELLETSLARIQHELGTPEATDYRVVVEGAARRLHPIVRDEVYRVGREAVVNAFRHAQARGIAVEIAYSARALRLLVRDDGCGIESGVLASVRKGSCGLPGMRERAERIGARLQVRSRSGAGTEVELSVPGGVAFQELPAPGQSRERGE